MSAQTPRELVVFRVDASIAIGTGHVMRCLVLADALGDQGYDCFFICRSFPGDISALVEERGFEVARLSDAITPPANAPAHAPWLGCGWQEDADQTIAALIKRGRRPAWMVVDHYAIDERWERCLRGFVEKVLVLDDLADRPHDCDMLVDQNLKAVGFAGYERLLSTRAVQLVGPAFALLGPQFSIARGRIPPRRGPVQRVIIYFGGSDFPNLTGRCAYILAELQVANLLIDVLPGRNYEHGRELAKLADRFHSIRVHEHLDSLAGLFANADLAIGAAGATSWERLCLGLPSIVVAMAENQRPIADALSAAGLVRSIGNVDSVTDEEIREALLQSLSGEDGTVSARSGRLVDGLGAQRVAFAMTYEDDERLSVRPSRHTDLEEICNWLAPGAEAMSNEALVQTWQGVLRDLEKSKVYSVESSTRPIVLGCVAFSVNDDIVAILHTAGPHGFRAFRRMLECALVRFRRDFSGNLRFLGAEHGTGGLRISVCSDEDSWANEGIAQLVMQWTADRHTVTWTHDAEAVEEGDLCFFLSYGRIVGSNILARNGHNLVVHASALPEGRGWSPLTWQVLEGKNEIPVTLFEAAESVDSGAIYATGSLRLNGGELIAELRAALCDVTNELCLRFVANYQAAAIDGRAQVGTPTFYPRRRPAHSQLDIEAPLASQFNLLRTADPDRYPAWFVINGRKYLVRVDHAGGAQ